MTLWFLTIIIIDIDTGLCNPCKNDMYKKSTIIGLAPVSSVQSQKFRKYVLVSKHNPLQIPPERDHRVHSDL